MHITRRQILAGGAIFTAWATIPTIAWAARPRDPRFLAVILRGGMDGLGVVAPVGDPAYADIRDEFAMASTGADAGFALDGFFALNARMPKLDELYRTGEALFVHAVHTPYRERSHFEAQDVLENGTTAHGHFRDGWLGRATRELSADSEIRRTGGFAAAPAIPLVMRGAGKVVTWLPPGMPAASDDTRMRLLSMYEHTDPVLADILSDGLALERVTGPEVQMAAAGSGAGGAGASMDGGMAMQVGGRNRHFVNAAVAAGRAMSQDDGPRLGFLDMTGFDTHRAQKVVDGALGQTLSGLDALVAALRSSMGEAWGSTVVAITTEFGRTVRINSSQGTDHGSATVAMLVGGAVRGGRVVADWPGLTERALHEGRDLAPTTDLRAVLKGTLRDHLGIDAAALGTRVFPDSADVRPMDGLIRT